MNDQIVTVRIAGQEFQAVVNNSIKDTIIHENLYIRALLDMADYLEASPTYQELRTSLRKRPKKTIETDKCQREVRGPFRIPAAIEGVWIYLKVYVSSEKEFLRNIRLAPTFMGVNALKKLVQGSVTTDLDNDFTVPMKFWPGESREIETEVLLDTGAAPNVITTGVWRKIGCPKLSKSQIHLLLADQGKIGFPGRTNFYHI